LGWTGGGVEGLTPSLKSTIEHGAWTLSMVGLNTGSGSIILKGALFGIVND